MTVLPPSPVTATNKELAAGLGLAVPSVHLPRPGLDLKRWAVIACDQFTSQPEYWEETAAIVGLDPSALHLILPEIYLEHPGGQSVPDRISRINTTMRRYLADGTLSMQEPGWIAIDRATPGHPSRKGLILAIDLECYDFKPGNRQLIRATEGTVLERIPPRLAIRRDAPLELPHVQLLIDDPQRTVIEPLLDGCRSGRALYETDLMQGGGHLKGWFVPGGSDALTRALHALASLESLSRHGLLFAVGDGNHSLATAKAHWENLRSQVAPDHPARYALVEVVNIHDSGLDFEPIHRVVFNLAPDCFLEAARAHFAGQGLEIIPLACGSQDFPDAGKPGEQAIPLLWKQQSWLLKISSPHCKLAAGSVQEFLDGLSGTNGAPAGQPDIRIDYIHGGDTVRKLAGQGQLGLLLPALDKYAFFDIIAADGVLPRKTFSMGEAREKRYYFECRSIR